MDVRIIELPRARAAAAGPSTDSDPFGEGALLTRFDRWFSALPDPLRLAPRDLMWFDELAGGLVWAWHLAPGEDAGEWHELELPGGLYASAICRDPDEADGERVLAAMMLWLTTSPFREEITIERPVAFRIVSPPAAKEALGYHQMELLVPIAVR